MKELKFTKRMRHCTSCNDKNLGRIAMKFFSAILFIFFVPMAYAGTPDAANSLTALLSQTQTMQADFEQTVRDKNGQVLSHSFGEMYIGKDSQFRWETKSPNKQMIVANGKEIWIYDEDLEQATVRDAREQDDDVLGQLFSGDEKELIKHFQVKFLNKRSRVAFELLPKDEEQMIRKVELTFYRGKLQEIRMFGNLDNETVVKFSSIETNQQLRASIFKFKPPIGVDVIRQ